MAKYKIQIEELLQKVVEVEAKSLDEAFNKIKGDYENCKIELNTDDLKDVIFSVM